VVDDADSIEQGKWIDGSIIDIHLACTWINDASAKTQYITFNVAHQMAHFNSHNNEDIQVMKRRLLYHRNENAQSGQVAFLAQAQGNHLYAVYFDYKTRLVCIYGRDYGKAQRVIKRVTKAWIHSWNLGVVWARLAMVLGFDGTTDDVHAFKIEWIQASQLLFIPTYFTYIHFHHRTASIVGRMHVPYWSIF
jgi:hypothetical protein